MRATETPTFSIGIRVYLKCIENRDSASAKLVLMVFSSGGLLDNMCKNLLFYLF